MVLRLAVERPHGLHRELGPLELDERANPLQHFRMLVHEGSDVSRNWIARTKNSHLKFT